MYIFTPQDSSLYLSFFFLLSSLSLSSLIFFRFLSCNSHFFFFLSSSLFLSLILFSYSSLVFSLFHTHSLFSVHCFCCLIYFSLPSFISLLFNFVYIPFNSFYFVLLYFFFFLIFFFCF